MAISFDESNDYYVISDAASMTLQDGDWCVGIWTYVVDNAGSGIQVLLSNNNWGVTSSFNMGLRETGIGSSANKWHVETEDGDGTTQQQTSTGTPGADSTWRLVIAQRHTTDSEIQLWHCEFGQAAVKQGTDSDANYDAINGDDWYIGRRYDGNAARYYGSVACEFFKGDFSLSGEEISALGSGLPVYALGHTLDVYLPMQTAEATLKDLVGSNDATRSDAPATAEHAPITPPMGVISVQAVVAAGTNAMPMAMNHYRRLRAATQSPRVLWAPSPGGLWIPPSIPGSLECSG